MFTGIVQKVCTVKEVVLKENLTTFVLVLPDELGHGLQVGASVALEGVCMTATKIESDELSTNHLVSFDAMQVTLDLTTLGQIKSGDQVNVERSFKQGDEVGGHIVSGHVHSMAEIVQMDESVNQKILSFKVQQDLIEFLQPKGFVALAGASLTIVDITDDIIRVSFIPETLRNSTFGMKQVGDWVNVEPDPQTVTIVNTVKRYLDSQN